MSLCADSPISNGIKLKARNKFALNCHGGKAAFGDRSRQANQPRFHPSLALARLDRAGKDMVEVPQSLWAFTVFSALIRA